MPQIKSQMKRVKTNEKRRLANASFKNSIRTAMKAVEKAVASNDLAQAQAAYALASKKLDKSISKGIHHKNYVARQKSHLAKLINTIAQ